MSWHSYSIKERLDLEQEFQIDLGKGLEEQQVVETRKTVGANVLDKISSSWWDILWRQIKSPFIFLLFFAALLSFAFGEHLDAWLIVSFIAINTILGFWQEFRSEKTAKLLMEMIAWQSRVIRAGREQRIDSAELVPGDVIILEHGDKVGADIRLFECHNFSVDESSLTGEAVAVFKQGELLVSKPQEIHQAENIVFSGTTVLSGRALGVVIATGANSEFGKIYRLVSGTKKVSNFEKGIAQLSKFILKLVVVTLVLVVLANILIDGGLSDVFTLIVFAIALAIGVIPEGLPLVMTFSFSKGAAKLAKKQVLIKRLSAIEDLGSVKILCSDKTGTLTEGKMKLANRLVLEAKNEEELLLTALLGSNSSPEKQDPFDLAIKERAGSEGERVKESYDIIFDSPFDPNFRRNNVLVEKDERLTFIVRGASEELVKMADSVDLKAIESWIAAEGRLGRRVLAIASKELRDFEFDSFAENFRDEENGLKLLGLISFTDPIKSTTLEAVKKAKKLGIEIKIITGDGPEVAGAIGTEIGLCPTPEDVITMDQFNALPEADKLSALNRYNILSRFTPEKKYEIISRLQAHNNVGYLGDGINDAPALKKAGVSLAVNNASDIAKETADIILLENDLSIIIDGIREGRIIFNNGLKYLKATIASNFGNFYAIIVASLLIPFLPMLPVQILLLNLLSDFPMIAIAGDSVDEEELAEPRRYQTKDLINAALILGGVSAIFDLIFFIMFYRQGEAILQTNWFIASVVTELVFIYSIRTNRPMLRGTRPGRTLTILTILAGLAAVSLPFMTFGQSLFNFVTPTHLHVYLILGVTFIYLITTEVVKRLFVRSGSRHFSLNTVDK